MSNAMRMGKRTLASVAAGALALGVVSFVGTTSADAATHKTPKAAYGGSVDAIRNGTVGNIPAAKGTIGMKNAPTTLQVVTAPTNSAKVYVGDEGGDTPAGGWDNATLLSRDDSILYASNYDDSTFGIAVDTAGSYTINMGNGTDTSTISFTTAGAPASLAWDPTSQTATIGSLATMILKVKDSAGSLTQAAVGDTIAVAASADDTPSDASVTAAEIYLGKVSITATAQSGTQSITATPQGTLPGLGVTAVSTSLTGSGTVSSTAVKSITVTTPSTAVNTTTAGAGGQSLTTTLVPVGSGNITISVEDTATASVGNVIQLAAKVSAGSITDGTSSGTAGAADDTIYTTVTTDSNKKATWSFTVSGSALNSGSTVTITQVNVTKANVSPMARDTITQTDPAVSVDTVTTSPDDSLLAAIGTVTPVTVTVKDQFGNTQSGWTVTAYRGAIGGTTLAVGTTNGSGQAVVNVTNVTGIVSGTTENYSFKAQYGSNVVNLGQSLSIAYTTDGGVTAIAVSSSSGTSPSTAVPALVTQPVLFVPDDTTGKANGLSSGTFTVSSGAGTAATGGLAQFSARTTPINTVTYSVAAGSGLYLSKTAPTTWDGGTATLAANSDDSIYVWGTKAGVQDLSVTSGGLTVAMKVKIVNRTIDAYNIAVTPAADTMDTGSFKTVTASVTDYWGNVVASVPLTATASGQVLLAGNVITSNGTTDASGNAAFTALASASPGTGLVTITPNGCTASTCPALASGYTKPASLTTAPAASAASTLTIKAPVTQSLVIVGERTTVNGKSGISVDGESTGFDMGAIVNPWVKLAGQTEYTKGVDKEIADDGTFSWQRKTGKKAYVYFKSADGTVKSNTVIIQTS